MPPLPAHSAAPPDAPTNLSPASPCHAPAPCQRSSRHSPMYCATADTNRPLPCLRSVGDMAAAWESVRAAPQHAVPAARCWSSSSSAAAWTAAALHSGAPHALSPLALVFGAVGINAGALPLLGVLCPAAAVFGEAALRVWAGGGSHWSGGGVSGEGPVRARAASEVAGTRPLCCLLLPSLSRTVNCTPCPCRCSPFQPPSYSPDPSAADQEEGQERWR